MVSWISRIAVALFSIVMLFVLVGLFLPRQVVVQRTISINATPETVFGYVNELPQWSKWSPWYELEPDADYRYSGPPAGVGATMQWSGEQVGAGKQTIVASQPYETIETELDFGQQGTASAHWDFTALEDENTTATKVTWGFQSDMGFNPVGRWFGLLMESWLGSDYEQGLENLKRIAEH